MTALRNIRERGRSLPILAEADVCVVGGGVAGAAAATASARAGARTVLIERFGYAGGLATGGLVLWFLSLDDGRGRKIVGGLPAEMVERMEKLGGVSFDDGWKKGGLPVKRFSPLFNPEALKSVLDMMLEESGVDVYYHIFAADPIVGGGKIEALAVETRRGRKAVKADVFIDATGDADLATRAGAQIQTEDNDFSVWFRFGNVAGASVADMEGVFLHECGMLPAEIKKWPKLEGMDEHSLTQYEINGRKAAWMTLERLRKEKPEKFGKAFLIDTPTQPDVRRTRRIIGEYDLSDADEGRRFEDSVGIAADWRAGCYTKDKLPPVWHLPYRALVAKGFKNLLAAGRCIGAGGGAWEVWRVIAPCATSGEAAGMAAAQAALRLGGDVLKVDAAKLRASLAAGGVEVDYKG